MSNMLDGLTDEQVAALLIAELKDAPPVTVKMSAFTAYSLVSILQLACRHPKIDQQHVTLVKDFIRQLGQVGPATAASFEIAWDKSKDRDWRA